MDLASGQFKACVAGVLWCYAMHNFYRQLQVCQLVNSWIQYHFLYKPIRSLLGDRVWRLFPELAATERMSRDALEVRTRTMIDGLLQRAYLNSGYFRERLASAGYCPAQGYDPDVFRRIPSLTKADIRAYMDFAEVARARASRRSTSGSTGEPLVFGKDRVAARYMDAAMHQVYGWYGIHIGDREGRFWGRAITPRAQLKQRIKDRLLNRRRLSAFQMDDENCARFWNTLQRFRPHYFYCYPNAVFEFADYLRRTGQPGHELGLKAIICTGEVLFPHHEALLREVFRCPIVNEYGSTENGIIAFRCPEGNMHVLAQNIFLEIVDDDGNPLPLGATGRILVTELHSTDVPFIRYTLGDTGALSPDPCPCGRSYPVLTVQSGRIDSFIITPTGKKVYDAVLAYAFKHTFKKFRGYQRRYDLLEVEYVPTDGCDAKVLDGLRRSLKEYLGADMHVEFKQVENIRLSQSGKAQYFVTELPLDQDGK